MYGKMIIRCCLVVRTGLHIGAGNAFSAIGAVDSQVVRDPLTGLPMIPGSSLKGKLRSLLARSLSKDIQRMPDFDQDDGRIKRLFGSANPVHRARLQFADCYTAPLDTAPCSSPGRSRPWPHRWWDCSTMSSAVTCTSVTAS